jgi:hypothetical protein
VTNLLLRVLASLLCVAACSCGESSSTQPASTQPVSTQPVSRVVFYTAPASYSAMAAWAEGMQPLVEVAAVPDPVAAVQTGAAEAISVAIVADLECGECYRLDRTPGGWSVHGGAPLGIQYGATQLLEDLGFRFFHPRETHVPARLGPLDAPSNLGQLVTPERSLRGLQLHTLHPIEPFFDFWVPGDDAFDGARRTIDWLVKNRGNYLQWVGLDTYQRGGPGAVEWQAHTKRIVDYAHLRGVKVGFAIQLFGSSNLQRAFDLLDSANDVAQARTVIHDRLAAILPALGFDRINLSFGEFFGADPDLLISMVNLTRDVIDELSPGVEMTATIHVGDPKTLSVTYHGETLLYYFLVKFADARVIPWVHTVMYYELFGDAGGAYKLDTFAEHASFLLERLQAGQRVAFFPESAYWITFDNPVPTYVPLYMRSRWQDLTDIDARATAGGFSSLDEHVLFSSGWEWGYWQNDYATLRMTYTRPAHWQDTVDEMFTPWGAGGAALAHAITALGDLQHDYLIGHRLAAYLAARDGLLDIGERTGIRSEPYRPAPNEVGALAPAALQTFRTDVLAPLGELTTGMADILDTLRNADLPADDPWVAEVRDGVEVTYQRARFVNAIYNAAVAIAAAQPAQAFVDEAGAALDAGRTVVARRHSHLHNPDPQQLLSHAVNATTYPYGYLYYADQLCYWQRERAQLGLLLGEHMPVPSCFSVTLSTP